MALTGLFNKTPQQAKQADAKTIISLCSEASADYLAKPMTEQGFSLEQAQAMLNEVEGVRDACAAAFSQNLKAGAAMADSFLQSMYVEGNVAQGVRTLLLEATAEASGEEIDHHPPAAAGRSFDPSSFYRGDK